MLKNKGGIEIMRLREMLMSLGEMLIFGIAIFLVL